ncbi:uncharacterized protein PHALS_04435 [Plasmopara halstedii]|uniref:Uncharacterized protein n=1 Tax=Plasmopara halstedii TaxID=4781 RepID=A0A0P1AYN4_PLAHL|nr:uncharacterized protein PHALS_04435 [Plasmopara halstedii]CEG47567.1 hypothetical protein PHALS_04435 [Plasmopara halstedii]|eukprot:XP_024583936.1 hypothetical protein PHALS_04435 [Plasmopara halstedii]
MHPMQELLQASTILQLPCITMDLQGSNETIKELVSSVISLEKSTNDILPQFIVHSVLPSLEVQISRTSYVGIVALILKNLGADKLRNTLSASCESEHEIRPCLPHLVKTDILSLHTRSRTSLQPIYRQCLMTSDDGHCNFLMASSESLEMQHTWNCAASTGNLKLDSTLLKAKGTVCLEPLLSTFLLYRQV